MKKNTASQVIGVQMITTADGTAFTGTVTALVTIDGGTQSASGGTGPTHEGNGFHTYLPTQAETNGDHIGFTFTGPGAIPVTVQVYTSFPQTGDNFARLGAPAGASVSADVATRMPTTHIAATAGKVDGVALVDTTTTNTDMRGTDGANTATPPTAGAIADAVLDEALSEPSATFTWAGATLRTVVSWIGALSRNKVTQTATTQALRNDADAGNVSTSTVSDDGTTFTRGEWS